MSREEIKYKSKAQLGGSIFSNTWMYALLACFIYDAVISLFTPIAKGFSFVIILVMGPLAYALAVIFLKIVRGNYKVDIADMLVGFKDDFGGTFLIGLMTYIFTVLWSLLFIIPGIVKYYSYSMAYYIKADHPEYDWNMCIKESMRITNGHKGDLFVLDLSFIGWYLVGVLCLGVGVFWVVPYHMTARANFYEALVGITPEVSAQ